MKQKKCGHDTNVTHGLSAAKNYGHGSRVTHRPAAANNYGQKPGVTQLLGAKNNYGQNSGVTHGIPAKNKRGHGESVTQGTCAAPYWEPGDLLWLARQFAEGICKHYGTATADDVRILFDRILGPYWTPGNWMGSIFRDNRFVPTGGMVTALHKSAKGRLIREWKLRP